MSEHKRKQVFQNPHGDRERPGGRRMRRSLIARVVGIVIVTITVAWLFPRSTSVDYEYEVGSIWSGDTLRAPFAFPLYKDEATYEVDVRKAVDTVLPIFIPTGMNTMRMEDTLFHIASAIAISESPPPFLSQSQWAYVVTIPAGEPRLRSLTSIAKNLAGALSEPYKIGVIDRSKGVLASEKIVVRRSEVYEDVISINRLFDSLGLVHTMETRLARTLNPEEGGIAVALFRAVYEPTYVYSESLTEAARESARQGVTRSQGIVAENEVVVATGERISEATKLKLSSYKKSWLLRGEEENVLWQFLGNLGHASILIGLATLYLLNFRRRIFNDNLQLGILMAALLLMAGLSYLSVALRAPWPIEFLILIPFLSMLAAILFDSRTAFYMTVVGSFVVAGVRGNDYMVAIACLSAGVLAAYTVRDIKSRTQLFRSIAFALLGYTLAIVALGLERGSSSTEIGRNLIFAAINSTISPVLTFGTVFLIERFFGIATDLRLLEYDTLNHPLLRALADKAPGTYQHTLTMAHLAESAAAAIGANALLAKVGALYHDVGKIAKAEYFVENQMEMANKHDKIKPEMSARIIRNHVHDGMELAREYRLPQRIIDFIPMHHGTTTIKYFLDKAREANPNIEEKDFRYPGPLPQTRETAIVMLADGVEATVRSLPNATPKLIEETVDRAIKKRFAEGQLDQCELTLSDLSRIRAAFVKNLVGISHPRIQYKNDDAEPEDARPKQSTRSEPVIPYIDDAFGGETPR